MIYVQASFSEPRSQGGVLPRGYLDLSLWRADTPMKSMLVGPGLASEHSYQKKLQEVGQSGTEPMSETRVHLRTHAHTHAHSRAIPQALSNATQSPSPLNTHSHVHTLTRSPQLTLSTPAHPPETTGRKDLGSGATQALFSILGLLAMCPLSKALHLSRPFSAPL